MKITLKIGNQTIEVTPSKYDEQEHLIMQLINNGCKLVYGLGEYPIGIKGGCAEDLKKIGLLERYMEIPIDKWIDTNIKLNLKPL